MRSTRAPWGGEKGSERRGVAKPPPPLSSALVGVARVVAVVQEVEHGVHGLLLTHAHQHAWPRTGQHRQPLPSKRICDVTTCGPAPQADHGPGHQCRGRQREESRPHTGDDLPKQMQIQHKCWICSVSVPTPTSDTHGSWAPAPPVGKQMRIPHTRTDMHAPAATCPCRCAACPARRAARTARRTRTGRRSCWA